MIIKQVLSRTFLIGVVPVSLILVTGLLTPVAGTANSDPVTSNVYQVFTSAPDRDTQNSLLHGLRGHAVRPAMDMSSEFRQMVLDGHPLAMEVAFENLAFADGADAALIYELLGESVSSNPEAFLQALTEFLSDIDRLDALLGHLGEEYTDDLPASTRALEERYLALRDVDSPDYNEAREHALLALSKMIYENRALKQLKQAASAEHHD